MKLQKTTLLLIITALLLGGFVYFLEMEKQKTNTEQKQNIKQIFDFKEADISGFTIEKDGKTLEFVRTQRELLPWQMKQPVDIEANDAAVSFLINLLVDSKRDRTLTITENQKSEYGLEQPLATIKVKLKNNQEHQLNLGKLNFDGKLIYTQIDQGLTIYLLPIEFKYAVERDLAEWQQKPVTK